jgi:GNAT superfamily N-acetyltransferase
MRIQEIDARTASDAVLARFHEVELACHEELESGTPWRTREEAIAFHRHQPETHTTCHWLCDGGVAALWMHGPTATFAEVLVEPDQRRRRIGTALLKRVVERCRELGVEVLRSDYSTAVGAAFAARVGAAEEYRTVRSLLTLQTAELPESGVPNGFRLSTWFERVPNDHLDALVRVRAAMDDAPHPEGMDYPAWSAEDVRASEESLRRREREMRLTVAIGEDGEIGAFTELRLSKGSTLGFTDDTGTAAEHRRKGLARAVKVESLRRLREDHPEVEAVITSNAEANAAIRTLNESIGFRAAVVETTAALQIRAA